MGILDKIKNSRILRDRYGEGKPIKILMVGGPRCGKTTTLASIFEQMRNGSTNDFLSASDRTSYTVKGNERQDTIFDKVNQLRFFIERNSNGTFIIDTGKTNYDWDYKLQFRIPGTNKKIMLEFKDVPGEYFVPGETDEKGNLYADMVVDYINDTDIFIVAIDTPFLMSDQRTLNKAANCIEPIEDLLDRIQDQDGRGAKQVIFVPIKCEKWMQEQNGVEELIAKIEEEYSNIIRNFNTQTEASIVPIQTAGDIIFTKLTDPYRVVNKTTGDIVKKKCSKYNERKVINEDGQWYQVNDNEEIVENPDSTFSGRLRPYTWYHLNRNAKYAPYNCEQLPLHILRFMFNKFASETPGGIRGRLRTLFGSITVEDMQNCLDKLSKANLIKDNVEGIKTIKKCF